MKPFPTTIASLEAELIDYLYSDQRQDAPFRFTIASAQMGSLVAHLNHDEKENPGARPYNTPAGERNDFGHAILQLLIYGVSRKLSVQESINSALVSLRERDWKAKTTSKIHTSACTGRSIARGNVTGHAFVDPFCERMQKMPKGCILIAAHPKSDISIWISKCAGVVTDHGGTTCHAAIITRECGIPCLVGTGHATEIFETGDVIHLSTESEYGICEKVKQ
jgi:phosphohistidine swiveling domain-containing protein